MLDVPQLSTSVHGVVLRLLTSTDAQPYFEVINRNRDHVARRMHASGRSLRQMAEVLECSPTTVMRAVRGRR